MTAPRMSVAEQIAAELSDNIGPKWAGEIATKIRAALSAAEKERDEALRAAHHPLCNYWMGPFGGPGCICVRQREKESAERDAWRREALAWREHDARNVIPGTHYIHRELRNARDIRAENEAAGLK